MPDENGDRCSPYRTLPRRGGRRCDELLDRSMLREDSRTCQRETAGQQPRFPAASDARGLAPLLCRHPEARPDPDEGTHQQSGHRARAVRSARRRQDNVVTRHDQAPGACDMAGTERLPGNVPCPYCARDIAVADFAARTARRQLLSATCGCGRTVTMATTTLRRRATP